MHTPTKAQVQVVIDNLMKVLPFAKSEENLNMMTGVVPDTINVCKTTCCHGGWYAVAKLIDETTMELTEDSDYQEGANMMSEDLGLKVDEMSGEDSLQKWSKENPDIWWGPDVDINKVEHAKEHGAYHFSSAMAFYHPEKRPEGAKTLADIIQHWKEVQERLPV